MRAWMVHRLHPAETRLKLPGLLLVALSVLAPGDVHGAARPPGLRPASAGTPAAVAQALPDAYRTAIDQLRTAKDPTARAVAAIGLGHGFQGVGSTSAPEVLDALHEAAVVDPDATVQAMAAYALCAHGDRRGVSRVVAALRERLERGADPQGVYSDAVRLPVPYLFRALGRAGGPEATRFLIDVARQAPQAARVVAIAALGLVPEDDPEVERTLSALAGDLDPAVRGVARFVIDERGRRGKP